MGTNCSSHPWVSMLRRLRRVGGAWLRTCRASAQHAAERDLLDQIDISSLRVISRMPPSSSGMGCG